MNGKLRDMEESVRMSNVHLNKVPKGETRVNRAKQWLRIFQNELMK